jgi:two-component sensor histidine kinase
MPPEIHSGPYEPSLSPALIEDVVFPSRDLADGERDEQPPTLLVDELNHRIRNILTMIQAIVNRTQATSVEDYRARLIARISGLGNVHQLIGLAKGQSIRLTELLRRTLSPGKTDDRFDLAGPDVSLDPTLSLALHLVFHELATNASKHGALSSPLGWIKTRWKLTHVPGGRLMLVSYEPNTVGRQ